MTKLKKRMRFLHHPANHEAVPDRNGGTKRQNAEISPILTGKIEEFAAVKAALGLPATGVAFNHISN